MYDTHNSYEHGEDAMGENVRVGNVETKSNGRRFQETPPYFVATMRILREEMQSYRLDNEILVKDQEEKNHLNATMLQSLTDIQMRMSSGHRVVHPKGSKRSSRRRNRSPSGSSDSEGSIGSSTSSSHKNKKRFY